MNKYLKDNLILGDSLENFFGWITLLQGVPDTPETPGGTAGASEVA